LSGHKAEIPYMRDYHEDTAKIRIDADMANWIAPCSYSYGLDSIHIRGMRVALSGMRFVWFHMYVRSHAFSSLSC
jgi:hypothetical protein